MDLRPVLAHPGIVSVQNKFFVLSSIPGGYIKMCYSAARSSREFPFVQWRAGFFGLIFMCVRITHRFSEHLARRSRTCYMPMWSTLNLKKCQIEDLRILALFFRFALLPF